MRGIVKWFSSQKGYGFIRRKDGKGKDVFVHHTSIRNMDRFTLSKGEEVRMEVAEGSKGPTALQVEVVGR